MRWAIIWLALGLTACEYQRQGTQVLPQAFMGSEVKLLAVDLAQITVSVARPRPGAMAAYSDCVAAGYALIRGLKYARRVAGFPLATQRGMADVVRERWTYLVTDLTPAVPAPTAEEIAGNCRSANIPTI